MGKDNRRDSNLPEAVERNDYPIAVPRDEEGSQPVLQGWNEDLSSKDVKHVDYTSTPRDVAAEKVEPHERSRIVSRRGCMVMSFVLGIAIVVTVSLGAGLGVGLHSGSSKTTNNAAQPQSASTTPSASTTSTSETLASTPSASTTSPFSPASSTCSGVTSGQTGIACVSCNQTDSKNGGYLSDTGSSTTRFTELCNVDMPTGSAVYNATTSQASTMQNLTDIAAVISYSFTDCMDQCARYNQQYGTDSTKYPCKAVTYGANLTAAIVQSESEGNCYLKDARGSGIYDSSGLVMSGYIDT